MEIKAFCAVAGIAQIDAGPKGGVLQFRNNQFAKPEGLVDFMQRSRGAVRLQPDHKLVYKADWMDDARRIKGVLKIVKSLAAMVREDVGGGVTLDDARKTGRPADAPWFGCRWRNRV